MIEHWIEIDAREYVAVCPVHSVMEADRDPEFRLVLNRAGMRVPDGMPLVWMLRHKGHQGVGRVRGTDLVAALSARSSSTSHTHYFYGGAPGVADEMAERLRGQFPGLRIVGTNSPGLLAVKQMDSAEQIARINAANPDILWLGLGCPKQEWWSALHRDQLNARVIVAVGAAFDFHSGRITQAPKWMQNNGLEWLHRLKQDPQRLWKRYLLHNTTFILKALPTLR